MKKKSQVFGDDKMPYTFISQNVTIGEVPIPVVQKVDATVKPGEDSDDAPIIFPKTNDKVPIIDLPPLIFPDDKSTAINQTALDILNASGKEKHGNIVPLPTASDENYYDSSDDSDNSDSVEEVQPIDKRPQTDNLEENFK
ncbi:hypothetical protein HA402_008232 [Bradysia odoriphaga]|nr:hypothetical protein HA402_008232 [Bradysia odoriphaga]